jgi:hypothetical protein
LTHELGHAIGATLTDQDWTKFYQLRHIPSATPRQGTNWNLSPAEDFAEVYKNIFTGNAVQTYYGELVPVIGTDMGVCMTIFLDTESSYTPKVDANDPTAFFKSLTSPSNVDYSAIEAKANADPKVQACRRDVMANPSKYKSDWGYGTPYESTVDQATKDFISGVVNR